VVDPAGAYAYALVNQNSACLNSVTGVQSFKVNSDGTMSVVGSPVPLAQATITNAGSVPPATELVSVYPNTLTMDTTGKYLFVADRSTTDGIGNYIPGSVSVFAISSGALTEVAGSPFFTTLTPPQTVTQSTVDLFSVAVTPMVLPTANSACADPGNPAPTTEYLYAVDYQGNQVFEFSVDPASGTLTPKVVPFPADQEPQGVVVDACNRFVFVTNSLTNRIGAYSICNGSTTQSQTCPTPSDGSLVQVAGSPFSMAGGANGPGPVVTDPYGNYIYVLGLLSNTVSTFRISPVTGSLTAANAVVATGSQPKAIAIRSDDLWLFVTNFNSASLSQYSITPATGSLLALPAITTDNYPWGVAVK
jgi:6-phosphogluconolactonase (cycloisomerase 2 family)